MTSLQKFIISIPVFIFSSVVVAVIGFGSSNASAQVVDYNGAVNEINYFCSTGQTIAHASYGSNPRLDMNTGNVTYDFNVLWKRCNGNYSSEYAVTGYDGNVCPAIGRYHANNSIETHDCIKYTDRHGEGRTHGVCGSYRCVYPGFNDNVRKGGAGGPPADGNIYSQFIASRTVTIPNWSTVGAVSGSSNVFIANVCGAHYYNSSSWGNTYCTPSYVQVSWSRPWFINGQSYIKNSPDPARTGLSQGTINAAPGNRLNWYHDLRNTGPNNMGVDIYFRVGKTGFSNGWNATNAPEGYARGNANVLFVYEYADMARPHTLYDVTQADVGNTLCQYIAWQRASSENPGGAQSNPACAFVPFNYTLTPSITNVTDNNPTEPDREDVEIRGSVVNNGPTKSRPNVNWQMTRIIYPVGTTTIANRGGGDSTQNPCTFATGEASCDALTPVTAEAGGYTYPSTTNYSRNTNIGSLRVGQRVCFMMSVQPYSNLNNNWRHSAMRCMVVSKAPKVNVMGGDLYTGRTLSGVTAPTNSKVSTSVSNTSAGTFGSWAEYGIIPTGLVTGMASGSGYVGGVGETSVVCGVSLLTFSNVNGPASGCNNSRVGNFTSHSSMPNVAARFKVTTATPRVSGNVEIRSLSAANNIFTSNSASFNLTGGGAVPASRWVVINAPNSTVTITGDIQYANGPFTSIGQIPQVVIIANNINIAEGVRNIDAWLIANGTPSGATINGGIINTCARPAPIHSGNCNLPLRVNGPVIANRLQMLRTAGAGPGAQSIEPAEVFNLRADAYLWAMARGLADGRVTTTSTTELPPRY